MLHEEIFSLIYYGEGGFNWSDVYDMPIWLRHFYIKSINKVLSEKAEATKKNQPTKSKVQRPGIF
jgi:hypothetical protein